MVHFYRYRQIIRIVITGIALFSATVGLSGEATPDVLFRKLSKGDFSAVVEGTTQQGDLCAGDAGKLAILSAIQHVFGIGVPLDPVFAEERLDPALKEDIPEAALLMAWLQSYNETGTGADVELWLQRYHSWKAESFPRVDLPDNLFAQVGNDLYPRYAEVEGWLRKRARAGEAYAHFNLFQLILNERIIPKAPNELLLFLESSADRGYGPALDQITQWAEWGFFGDRSPQVLRKYQTIGAEQGIGKYQLALAEYFLEESKTALAIDWLERAVAAGDTGAMRLLSSVLLEEDSSEKARGRALSLLGEAFKKNDVRAGVTLARLLYEKHPSRSRALWEKASEMGSGEAARLGWMYLDPPEGISRNPEEALRYAQLAVDRDVVTAHYIFWDHLASEGGEEAAESLFYHVEELAREGFADAQHQIGAMLWMGEGIEQDREEAATWWKLGAEKGNDAAQYGYNMASALGWTKEQEIEPFLNQLADWWEETNPETEKSDALDRFRQELIALKSEDKSAFEIENEGWDEAKKTAWKEAKAKAPVGVTDFKPPVPFHHVAPVYPSILRFLNIKESPTLTMVVGSDGRIHNWDSEEPVAPLYRIALAEALKHWRFIPGAKDGEAVPTRVSQSFPYLELSDKPKADTDHEPTHSQSTDPDSSLH